VTSIEICSGSKKPAVFNSLLYFGAIGMIVERKPRGGLLDRAEFNNALNDPQNEGGSFSETTYRLMPKGVFSLSAERPPERPQVILAKRPRKRPGPRFGKREPWRLRGRFGTSPITTPDNDLGPVFENARGRFGRVVSTKRPRGSFHNDPLAR
jgi:hypothetical protein